MNPTAKSMILKAQDNLDTAKKHLADEAQHDVVGYNLAQATECLLKALCATRDLPFPEGESAHDLDALMEVLEEDNLAAVSSHADVIELTQYNQTGAKVREDDRLDLEEYFGYVEDLKKLVREHTM